MDNKEMGKDDSELNLEELAAKAYNATAERTNVDAVQAFEKTDTGKKINQIKGIK